MKDGFDGEMGERKKEGMALAAVGLLYNFRNRTWNKEKEVVIITYDDSELKILQERMNQLNHDNEALRRQLQGSTYSDIADVKVENNVVVSPILITFPINRSVVSNQARVNLGFFAKVF